MSELANTPWHTSSYSATIDGCRVRASEYRDGSWFVEVVFGDNRVRVERDYCPSLSHAKAWAEKCAPLVSELARQTWVAAMEGVVDDAGE
jgi:hypothetical protein